MSEVIDLRELEASVLQQLITVELFVGHVNLLGQNLMQSSELSFFLLKKNMMHIKKLHVSLSLNKYLQKSQTFFK